MNLKIQNTSTYAFISKIYHRCKSEYIFKNYIIRRSLGRDNSDNVVCIKSYFSSRNLRINENSINIIINA